MKTFAAFLVLLVCLAAGLEPARALERPRVMVVIDASGSMRQKIGGVEKIAIERQALRKLLTQWDPRTEIGLAAYGHRDKASCRDVEVMREPGPLDEGDYLAALDGLSPKGQTPLTQAVHMAADALKYDSRPATIIVLADGPENCKGDPCVLADELAQKAAALTIHTIGFALDDPAAADQLACLSRRTGGLALQADDAGELGAALAQAAARIAAPAPQQATPQPAPEAANIALKAHVRMAPGVELPDAYGQPDWVIRRATADGSDGNWVNTLSGTGVASPLEPGSYVATVTSDGAVVKVPFQIAAGKVTDVDVNLNAGLLRAAGYLAPPLALNDEAAKWAVLLNDGAVLASKTGAQPEFMLPAGQYRLQLSLGSAQAVQPVTVAAGQTSQAEVALNAGRVTLTAVLAPGLPALDKGLTFEVRKAGAGDASDHDALAKLYDAGAQTLVPAGRYQFTAMTGDARATMEADIKPGDQRTIAIVLNAGRLHVRAPGAAQIVVSGAVPDKLGQRPQIAAANDDEIDHLFAAGRYHVAAIDANAGVLGERDFDVKAGATVEGSLP